MLYNNKHQMSPPAVAIIRITNKHTGIYSSVCYPYIFVIGPVFLVSVPPQQRYCPPICAAEIVQLVALMTVSATDLPFIAEGGLNRPNITAVEPATPTQYLTREKGLRFTNQIVMVLL